MNNVKTLPNNCPEWLDGKNINEPLFCQYFLQNHLILFSENMFFTPEGCMADEMTLKEMIFREIEPYACNSVPNKIKNIVDLLKIAAMVNDFPPEEDRIHLKNGTLFLDGSFDPQSVYIVRSRIPVEYDSEAPEPFYWKSFLDDLLYPEDIPTLQEFVGYCLLPTNKAQRMMIIKGNGGEGKSQIGTVLKAMFGINAKDGSVGKVSENNFARADLEHIHLMIDDDMRMEALKQTNYVKSLVTAKGKVDLERKKEQSYQGYMYARLLAFSNGDLQSLYDRSDGFYRRQLILTAKPKPYDRIDDPDLAEKMCNELNGILLWAFDGLKRLAANHFHFTESERSKGSRELLKQDANNVILFMEAEDYIKLDGTSHTTSKELYACYCIWCEENGFTPLKARSVSDYLSTNADKYRIEHNNNTYNLDGRRVWGFKGIRLMIDTKLRSKEGFQRVTTEDLPF